MKIITSAILEDSDSNSGIQFGSEKGDFTSGRGDVSQDNLSDAGQWIQFSILYSLNLIAF